MDTKVTEGRIRNIFIENIELEYYGMRNGTVTQFKITAVDNRSIKDDQILLVNLDTEKHPVPAPSGACAFSTYGLGEKGYGELQLYLCKEKTHFHKKTLEVIDSYKKRLEKDEKVSINEVFSKIV